MNTWNILKNTAAASAVILSVAGLAEAQITTSGVKGVVQSDAGTPVSGATVTVVDAATGLTRTTVTDASGDYSFRSLPVSSNYSISVDSGQFRSEAVEDVRLSLGDVTQLNFSLTSGASNTLETITVSASALDVGQEAVGPNATFDVEILENAPAINRNIADVLRIDPRIYVDESRGDINPIQCGGKNPRFNSLTLDGVRLNDGFGLNANGYPTERQPFPYDAIEQVAVELAPFDVQYGGFTACNINAVTKSGTNEFHGSAFFDYTSDDLQGDSLEGQSITLPDFDEKRYGLQVGGPIIKDKLFFSASYEKLEGANTFSRGVQGSGAINEVDITQAEIDEIADIARTVYQYEPGEVPSSFANEDEKFLAKLDWNINSNHRAAFTYNYNTGNNITASDGDLDEFEFSNHLYERSAELNQYVGQIYSDWTDNFSTEVRLGYVDLENGQNSIGGTDFGEIRVETDDVDVYLGGDDSRQSNELDYTIFNLALKGFYDYKGHNITFGYEREDYDIYNLFVQHTETEIRFDGIDNFRNGFADAIYYNNAPSNVPSDAAADWGYAINTFYLQDEFDVTDKLSLILGLRYDLWKTDDKPVENADFVADYGFSNDSTLDGEGLLQPRLAFTYDVADNLVVRGGIGRYSGGDPNVWLSNNFSANNVLQFGQRGRSFGYTDGSRSLFDADVNFAGCEQGVPEGPGYCVPQELFDAVANGVGDNFEINFLDPDFKIPEEWKYSLGATWYPDFAMENFLGGEYTVNADVLVSQGHNTAVVKRADLDQTGTTADGYPIFVSNREPAFVLTNASDGNKSLTASISVAKQYENGLDLALGYSYNDAEDIQPMTSSVAFSNYTSRAFFDPQDNVLSKSNYNIDHRFTALANYKRAFWGEYETGLSVFASANSGRPYSRTFNGTINPFNFTPFLDFQDNVLRPGAQRNDQEGSWWAKVDLRLEQELPGLRPDDRTSVFMVVDNFTNLLNDEWGVLREADFPLTVGEGDQAEARIGDASRYEVRFGIRYDF